MRTQDEIVARINQRRTNDFLVFEVSEYVDYLDFDHAKPFLKEDVTEEQWAEHRSAVTTPIDAIKNYMAFAWDKANDCRGISANRSINHCIAWLWLAEEDEFLEKVEKEYKANYHYYGKPILEMICERIGLDWKQWDNGTRTNED